MPRLSLLAALVALLLCVALPSSLSARPPLFHRRPADAASVPTPAAHDPARRPATAAQAPNTRDDDCRLRAFTLSYIDYLAQAGGTGNWSQAAHAALQLNRCNATQRAAARRTAGAVQWTDAERAVLGERNLLHGAPAPSCQWEVFVSPDGSDDSKGDIASPLRTIHRALALSRQLPRPTPYTYDSASPLACITLREGVYYLGYNASSANTAFDSRVGAIHLTPADSGLTIRGAAGEAVTLSGGVPLTVDWQKWRDGSYYTSLAASAIPAFDRWHFNELYVDNWRAVRAKYPNGDPAVHGLYDKVGWTPAAKAWSPPNPSAPATEIRVAAPTAVGHFTNFDTGVGGPASVFDPPLSIWATRYPPGSTYAVPGGVTLDAATYERSKQWSDPTDGPGYVFAFHNLHWGSWTWDITGLNNATGEVRFGRGGFQEARGSGAGGEYYVSNILEELDSDNEFYIQYSNNTLYYQPNSSAPTPTTFVASQLPCILSIQGTAYQPVRDVSIVGLTFAHTASTFMRSFEVPSGGDWSVHRGGAVFLDNTEGASISHSTFTQLGGNGVVLSNYNLAPTVIFSEFVWLGESAIVVLGSTSGIDGVTNRQQPDRTFIGLNLIHELGAYLKQTAAVVTFLSRSTYIVKNAMFNMPRAAININDGFAGGMQVAGNALFNTVRETSDHGPINSWDRQPYLVDHGSGPTMVPLTNHITANLIFNMYTSVWPIDHDDGSSYYVDSYNVLIYGGYKAYFGHDKAAHNQLYIYPDGQRFDQLPAFAEERHALRDVPWGASCGQWFSAGIGDSNFNEQYYNNTCVMQSTGAVLAWDFGGCDATTPSWQQVMPLTANNTYYTPSSAPFTLTCNVNGTAKALDFEGWQQAGAGHDQGSVQVPLKSTSDVLSQLLQQAADQLGMNGRSPARAME